MNALALVLDPTVQAALVTSFGLIIVALLGLVAEGIRRTHNGLRSVKKDTRGTREQVENSHATNLRDDLDEIRTLVERVATSQIEIKEGQRAHGYELGYLRKDIQSERDERVVAIQDVLREVRSHGKERQRDIQDALSEMKDVHGDDHN